MLEPPSELLQQRLRDWQLCRPHDLRRARARVRQLASDLPAFDSVWIDALVQNGVLTPYQARVLETAEPEQLRVGDFILLDELGRSSRSRTWLARRIGRPERCVVKQIVAPPESQAALVERGRLLTDVGAGFTHPQLVAPQRCWEDGGGFYAVSRHVSGLPLSELLVRRGRFPNDVVWEIGRQLLEGLAAWHARGQVHGDVRLSHVRLTQDGRVVLVEAGLRPVSDPEVTLHSGLALEAYDGLAPELIGVGQPPAPASDLYAVGCLLWQLLAGRPPYPVADPLAKLAAHQTRSVADVRDWAPDAPAALADVILALTHRDPAQRPASALDVLQHWGHSSGRGRARLRRFRRLFDSAVPHLRSAPAVTGRRTAVAAAVVVAGVLVWGAFDRGLRTELLALSSRWSGAGAAPATNEAPPLLEDRLPLPAPSPDGTVLLTEAGPYGVANLQVVGTLTIRGAEGVCPEIVVRDEPLRLGAQIVQLENVRLRTGIGRRAAARSRALILAQCQQLYVGRCLFDTGERRRGAPDEEESVGIAWRLVDPLDPQAGRLVVRDTLLCGRGGGILANESARSVHWDNVLGVQAGPALILQRRAAAPAPTAEFQHLTLRDAGPLLRLTGDVRTAPLVSVTAQDCVLLQPARHGTLIEVASAERPEIGPESVVWNGEGSMLPPQATVLSWSDTQTRQRTALPTDDLPLNGLAVGRVEFAGLPTADPRDSLVTETEAPRRSLEPPGIDPSRFGACGGGAAAGDEETPLVETPSPGRYN